MSKRATDWAWEQDVPVRTKTVLLALAKGADQQGIYSKGLEAVRQICHTDLRTIMRHLQELSYRGLISTITQERRGGGLYGKTEYRLGMTELVTTVCQNSHPDQLPLEVSPDAPLTVSPRAPLPDPPLNPRPNPPHTTPEWFTELHDHFEGHIKGRWEKARVWLKDKEITDEVAENTVREMKASIGFNAKKDKWEYLKANGSVARYGDLWSVFQTWAKRPRFRDNGRGPGRPTDLSSDEKLAAFRAAADRDDAERAKGR